MKTKNFLEKQINYSIAIYRKKNEALIYKRPVSICVYPKKYNQKSSYYFQNKSTVDYEGILLSKHIAIEAKSSEKNFIPYNAIKLHQFNYLEKIHYHGGIAIYIIQLCTPEITYMINAKILHEVMEKQKIKRVTQGILDQYGFIIIKNRKSRYFLDFLPVIKSEFLY